MDRTRRTLLAGFGTAALLTSVPARLVLAAADTERRLVVVLLRGALDGLAALPPHADPDYRAVRAGLALPAPGQPDGIADLDGFFGLHPALARLKPWYQAGELLALHAIASPYRERSHFDGQDLLDNGTGHPHGIKDGWLNRTLTALGTADRRLGLAVGYGVPLVLRGRTAVSTWTPSRLPAAEPGFLGLVEKLHAGDRQLAGLVQAALATDRTLDEMAAASANGMAGATPGAHPLGRDEAAMASAAGRLLAAPEGARIAVLELYGWDTHAGQGASTGQLANSLGRLAGVLETLRDGLGPVWQQSAVLVVTEFGRTAAPNGTGGTDHGTAGAALLTGGAVAGRRVIADWPGLARDKLYQQRDLAPTADLRAVFKGVLHDHLRLDRRRLDQAIFPDTGALRPMAGLIRT